MSRLFGPRNRRRGPGRGRCTPRRLARGLAAGLAVAAGCAVAPGLWRGVRGHPYFAVREVAVRGHARLAPDQIRGAAGIEPGMSIWEVDCDAAEARLRRQPWIRSVLVRRQLPHRVSIQVREERPAAILATGRRNPRLYYVAAHGRIFAPLGPDDARDFPYVTGLSAEELESGQAFGAHALRQALALIRVATRSGAALGTLSEVHIDRARGLTLLPVHPPVPIEVGWNGFAKRMARLPAVLALWDGHESEMTEVSVRFEDETIVRVRTPLERARRPAGA